MAKLNEKGYPVMSNRFRTALIATGLMVLLPLAIDQPTKAQEPAPPKSSEHLVKKKQDPARRVPAYFGQIGLTTEQRANIYAIQSKRMEKIDALEQQIATEKAEMLAQCEGALSETQKKLLDNLRKAAAEPATKSVEVAKPAK